MSFAPSQRPDTSPAGAVLRRWRGLRGKSQLDLSLDAGVSQRHISFIESGRSVPSRRMLVDLAEALGMPLRERNVLLLAAGYAPIYSEEPLAAPPLARVAGALGRMLRQNEPFPALVLDRDWTVVLANEAAPRFFGRFVDLSRWPQPRNLLRLVFDPEGLRPHLADWPGTARMLLARVEREAPGHVVDERTRELLAALRRYPGVEDAVRAPDLAETSPVVPLRLVADGATLSYFSLVTTVGTPRAVAADELRLECMLPADDETERLHPGFMARAEPVA